MTTRYSIETYGRFSMSWHREESYGFHDGPADARAAVEEQGPPPYPEWRGMPFREYQEWRVAKAEFVRVADIIARARADAASKNPPKDET